MVTMPSTPWPKSMEIKNVHVAASNMNPFTLQQQIQDWGSDLRQVSVSMASMNQAVAATWTAFLISCNGIVNVFQFPSAIVAKYPESLTQDGHTALYWRLSKNDVSWQITPGSIYKALTFEARVAL